MTYDQDAVQRVIEKVVAIAPTAGHSEDDVLRLAASVERSSEHPLAAAIVAAANERKIVLAQVMDFDSPAGKGPMSAGDGPHGARRGSSPPRVLGWGNQWLC